MDFDKTFHLGEDEFCALLISDYLDLDLQIEQELHSPFMIAPILNAAVVWGIMPLFSP
jgi:hypothetical protein